MSTINAGTGLISGLDFEALINATTLNQSRAITQLETQVAVMEAEKNGLTSIEANLLTLTTATTTLSTRATYTRRAVTVGDSSQLSVIANSDAAVGAYEFQSVRTATTEQKLSRGFVNADTQPLGEGTVVIGTGGFLDQATKLEALNGGTGVRRGSIRLTDRSGSSATIDLSNAATVDDILNAINENNDIDLRAEVNGDQIVLTDLTGQTTTNLTVTDIGDGRVAEDLGLLQSVAADSITSQNLFEITEDVAISLLNDGLGFTPLANSSELSVTLSDGTDLDIELSEAFTLGDVVAAFNDAEGNGGKLTAAIVNGALELTDTTGGVGTFEVENQAGTFAADVLGLSVSASGNTITGEPLYGGLNSVLLRNLNGGAGIAEQGQVTITNRNGKTATLDFSAASSLNEVLFAINNAIDDVDSEALGIQARINSAGTGITLTDTTGASVSNLIVADVATGTVAQDLGIVIDEAETSVNSGPLGARYINETESLSTYAPGNKPITPGIFEIVDTNGKTTAITVTSDDETIGDLITRINSTASIDVRAELNSTGDGFVIIDEAGGTGTLEINEVAGGSTAASLRLTGEAVEVNGEQQITSRRATIVTLDAEDTLEDLIDKINDDDTFARAGIFNDGSAFSPFRLTLAAAQSGEIGRLAIDEGDLDLGLTTSVEGKDALLRIGQEAASGFLISSSTNRFEKVIEGITVTLSKAASSSTTVEVSRDLERIETALNSFVDNYNNYISTVDTLTKYDSETNERGILQGDGFVLRTQLRLQSVLYNTYGPENGVFRSLAQLGISSDENGQLSIDSDKLQEAIDSNPDAVSDFFIDDAFDFGSQIADTITGFTDFVDGTFGKQQDLRDQNIELFSNRIVELNELLESRQQRLLLEFVEMEQILSTLESQKEAISGIQLLTVPTKSS